ncbi:hypothetical protein [Candidatus Pyrohabitans sp.]
MERKAVVVVNTAMEGGMQHLLDFTEFCAEWLRTHTRGGRCSVALIYAPEDGNGEVLNRLMQVFERRGIEAKPVLVSGPASALPEKINSLQPEVVFMAESKLGRRIKKELLGLQVEFTDPRRRELKISAAYGMGALILYAVIFISFSSIKGILIQKNLISVGVILGTVLAVAYLYGGTVAHALRYLGIKPGAH